MKRLLLHKDDAFIIIRSFGSADLNPASGFVEVNGCSIRLLGSEYEITGESDSVDKLTAIFSKHGCG